MSGFAGGCLCGFIRYKINRSHLGAVNCYCGMCRKAHGGAYSTHIPMRREQFDLLEGELTQRNSSTHGCREFCPRCGSHILVHGQTTDGSVAVPAGTLDGDPKLIINSHIFVADKVSWYHITDDLPQYLSWPPGVEASAG